MHPEGGGGSGGRDFEGAAFLLFWVYTVCMLVYMMQRFVHFCHRE
jgi:hypothetical protein